MAAVGEQFSLSLDFSSEKLGPDILWYNPPQQYKLRCNGNTGLKVLSVCSCFQCMYTVAIKHEELYEGANGGT